MNIENNFEIDEARKRASEALKTFRDSLKVYKKLTGQKPKFIHEKLPQTITDAALTSCKVFSRRSRLLECLPTNGGLVAEVGTQYGYWAKEILLKKNPEELHLFDVKFNLLIDDVRQNPSVKIHQGDSSTQLLKFSDEYFDWIYIDGDHSYAGVKKDIAQATKKVKRSGMLIFNDYTLWSPMEAIPYGVVTAVNELLNTGEWKMAAIALSKTGYWDVALTRTET